MDYREIGKTGLKAGTIGLGCENLDGKPYSQIEETINAALDNDINLLDIFMPGTEIRNNISKALGKRRENVMIQGHICSTDVKEQYDISRDMETVQKYFEEFLRIFGYADFGMLFFIDSQKDFDKVFDGGIADYVMKLKQNGDIRHIGFSSHNPEIAMKVIETGLVETMMFSINLAFDSYPADENVLEKMEKKLQVDDLHGLDPTRAALYRLCEKKNIGISVMKTLGSGKLISSKHTPFSKPMSVTQCVHYALSRPSVFSALLGCQTPEEVREAVEYFNADETSRDYTGFLNDMKNDFTGNCVYCNHCLPCPVEIDIASVNKYLDIAELDTENIPPSIRSHYRNMATSGKDCISCGSCEERCPFDVPIISRMKKASTLFDLP